MELGACDESSRLRRRMGRESRDGDDSADEVRSGLGTLPHRYLWWTVGVLLFGLLLAVGHALTKIPHVDEGDLASAAVSLLDRGRMAFPISYLYDETMRFEYFLPPFYPASLAAWFAAVGHSIVAWRLFHIIWLSVLVAAWIRIVRVSTVGAIALPLAATFLALNYDLLNLSVSRYDIVCAALNASAIAAYLSFRKLRFGVALLISNTFLACSALTHPYAVFGLIGTIGIGAACGDWRRLRLKHAVLVLLPYAVGFGVWALIIGDQWDTFISQMTSAAGNKKVDLASPLQIFTEDLLIRWWGLFAGWREGVPRMLRLKTAFLLVWALVPFVVFRFRTESTKGIRIGVIIYTFLAFLLLPFSDALHVQIYNIHVIAGFLALTAIAFSDLWSYRRATRPWLLVAVLGLSGLGVLGIGLRILTEDLQREYWVTVSIIRATAGPHDIIVGPSELAFGLGFDGRLRDDPGLTSVGREFVPQFIVETRDRGFSRTPSLVNCLATGVPRIDTLRYLDISPSTPSNHYRTLRLADLGEGPESGGEWGFILVRNCTLGP